MNRLCMEKNRIWLYWLLCIGMICLLAMFSGFVSRAETCGDYTYSVNSDGTAMLTYYSGSERIVYVPDKVDGIDVTILRGELFRGKLMEKVVIPEGVTAIEWMTFYECRQLKTVTLPASLERIGVAAFLYCTSLKKIDIPDNVTSIGPTAFCECESLESVNLPNSINCISPNLFEGCCKLSKIELPDGMIEIGERAFSGCSSLESVNIPDGVTKIGARAFSGCSSLESVNIPDGVTEIGAHTFSECSSLESVNIPDGVTEIGAQAFSGCSNLESVNIPDGIKSINSGVFEGCGKLSSITIPEAVTEIGDGAFMDCESVSTVRIPEKINNISSYAFYGCTNLSVINVDKANPYYCSKDGILFDKTGTSLIFYPPNHVLPANGELALEDGITDIGDYAFTFCNLKKITIPESVINIGGYVFAYSLVQEIYIPANIKGESLLNTLCGAFDLQAINVAEDNPCYESIDGVLFAKDGSTGGGLEGKYLICYPIGAAMESYTVPNGVVGVQIGFYYISVPTFDTRSHTLDEPVISRLRELIMPDSVLTCVIENCCNLTTIRFSEELQSMNLWNCSSLTDVVIPKNLKSIGDRFFYGCDSLRNIYFPRSISFISKNLFENCDAQPDIYVMPHSYAEEFFKGEGYEFQYYEPDNPFEYTGRGVGRIEITAYNGGLPNLVIPSVIDGKKVVSIGSEAFKDVDFLESVSLPYYVTSIGSSAFSGCKNLKSITLPKGLTNIGSHTFYGCRSLQNIVLPEKLKELPTCTFSGCCSLQQIIIPKAVTKLGYMLFYGCTALNEVEILGDIEEIENFVFWKCTNLRSVAIKGKLNSVSYGMFEDCISLNSIELPSGVTSIGPSAFSHCSELVRIVIPDSVTKIESYAFDGRNKNLTIITNISGNKYVYNYAITNKINVRGFDEEWGDYTYEELPAGDIRINSYCGNDAILTVPGSIDGKIVTAIGKQAFFNCGNLTRIVIPDSVTEIGEAAFEGCTGLKEITLPIHLKTIAVSMFSGCSSLDGVDIPAEVTSIDDAAFSGCSSLKDIVIPDSVKIISLDALPDPANKDLVCYVQKGSYSEEFLKDFGVSVDYIVDTKCFSYYDNGFGTGVIINGYSGIGGELIIPKKINRKKVDAVNVSFGSDDIVTAEVPYGVRLSENVFSGCEYLEEARLDNPKCYIYNSNQNIYYLYYMVPGRAFKNCVKLESATVTDITIVGESAFEGCTSLENLTLTGSISEIKESAFYGCKSLKSFVCPASLKTLGEYAFYGCSGLEKMDILSSNLAAIPTYAFGYCSSLTNIVIPESVTSIGDSAFRMCTKLSKIEVPGSVTSIGDYAFFNCDGLTKVTIPSSVKKIGTKAFSGCSSDLVCYVEEGSAAETYVKENNIRYEYLTDTTLVWGKYKYAKGDNGKVRITEYTGKDSEVDIPSQIDDMEVEGIGDEAFLGKTGISVITVPDTVEYIGDKAFMNCSDLTAINLPAGLQSIGSSAFEGCKKLEEITIPEKVTVINASTFNGCIRLSSVRMSDGLTEIGIRAFYNCRSLKFLLLPETVTTIGNYCFYNAQMLQRINIPAATQSIGYGAFSGCSGELCLLVNRGSYAVDYALDNNISFKYIDDVTSGSMQIDSVKAYTDNGANVIDNPTDIYVVGGGSLSIEVKAASQNNTVSYKWMSEDGETINTTWSDSGRIDIGEMQPGMYGTLTCYMNDGVDMDTRQFGINSGLSLSVTAEKEGEPLSGKDIEVEMGEAVTLRALPESLFDPEFSYTWEKDGVSLGITEPQITVTAAMEDSGTYTCTVTDGYTATSGSIKLNVKKKTVRGSLKVDSVKVYTDKGETITEDITDVVVAGKDSLELDVTASSVNGDVIYKWVKPGEDSTVVEWTDSGKLAIAEMKKGNYGTYSLYYSDGVDMNEMAFNVESGITADLGVYVNDAAVGQEALENGELDVVEEDRVRIDAVAASSVDAGLYYEWKKDGRKLDAITSRLPLVAERSSAGTYTCTVTDGYTEKSYTIKLNVSKKPVKGSLILDYIEVYTEKGEKKQEDITDITVAGNDSLAISLAAESKNGDVIYKWVKPGENSESVAWSKSGELSIASMKEGDYGTYSCYYSDGTDTAWNTFTVDSGITADISVSVNGTPVGQEALGTGEILLMAGDKVSMETKASSCFDAALTYKWSCSNRPLEGDSLRYEMSSVAVNNGGTYECEVSDGFTSRRVSVAIKVAEASSDISGATIEAIQSNPYSRKEYKPVPKIYYGGTELKKDIDFAVVYPDDCKNAGKKKLTIKGIGSYTGTKTVEYEITPYDATNTNLILLYGKKNKVFSREFTGEPIILLETQLEIKVDVLGSEPLIQGTDYTTEYVNNTEVGTASIIVLFKGNYMGTRTYQFEIVPPAPKLKSVKKKSNGLVLNWNKISCADGYYIYRSTKKDTGYKKLATVKKNKTVKYTDKKAKKGKKYYYKVVAYKKVSKKDYTSGDSNIVVKKR